MSVRAHNFGPGPAALPTPVLERIREELLDFAGSGISVLETSHRSPQYDRVHNRAIEALRELVGGAPEHEVVFMTGGARTQFSAVAMNLLAGGRGDYLVTGRWSELAVEAAEHVGETRVLWSSAETGFDRVPADGEFEASADAAYLHYTSNNTIYGTQFRRPPESGGVPLACDMSSDVLSGPLDPAPFGVIYAGAQKNLGPAGVTLVLVRKDLLDRSPANLPVTLSYARMAAKNSLLNTPPAFAIYALGLVLEHLLELGGLEAVAERNRAKADLLYSTIDGSDGFYRGHAREDSRSLMNVTFQLRDEALEAEFLDSALDEGFIGLKGHRSVGGFRASIYNAVERESVAALAQFMARFRDVHG